MFTTFISHGVIGFAAAAIAAAPMTIENDPTSHPFMQVAVSIVKVSSPVLAYLAGKRMQKHFNIDSGAILLGCFSGCVTTYFPKEAIGRLFTTFVMTGSIGLLSENLGRLKTSEDLDMENPPPVVLN